MNYEPFPPDHSIQENIYPYRLTAMERLHSTLVLVTVFGLYYLACYKSEVLPRWLQAYGGVDDGWAFIILLVLGGYLLFAAAKARSLFIELKGLRDVYETFRFADLNDVPLEDLFYGIRTVRFKGCSEMFFDGPQNKSLKSIFAATSLKNKPIEVVIDGIKLEDMTIHRLYKRGHDRSLLTVKVLKRTNKVYDCEALISVKFTFKDDRDETSEPKNEDKRDIAQG